MRKGEKVKESCRAGKLKALALTFLIKNSPLLHELY